MIRFKSPTYSPQPVLFIMLLLIATFGAACGVVSRSSTTGSEAFEGEIQYKESAGFDTEVRYFIKGARTRTETKHLKGDARFAPPEDDIALMDYSTGTMITLYPKTKTYTSKNMVEWLEKMAEAAEKYQQNKPQTAKQVDIPKINISPGKTETIAGVECQHWVVDDIADYCYAKGLENTKQRSGPYEEKIKSMAQSDKYKSLMQRDSDLSKSIADVNPEYAKLIEGGAFALKITRTLNGQTKLLREVTSVVRKSLDDSLFTAPADYTLTKEPDMFEIPGIKQ
jgi:uncharacterized protein DUF4412